jgi:hypothetical protein
VLCSADSHFWKGIPRKRKSKKKVFLTKIFHASGVDPVERISTLSCILWTKGDGGVTFATGSVSQSFSYCF